MNKDSLRKILISGIFLIPFIALINIGSLAFPFVTGKAFIFRILIEVMAGIWLLLIIIEKKYRPRFNWLFGTLLAFLAIITIADIFGVNPMKSIWGDLERMDGLVNMLHLAFYFIIVGTVIDTEKLWSRLFNTTIGVSVLLSLLGLVQLAGGMTIYTANGRLDSTIGNAAYFAVYLLIHIFLAIFMFAKRSSSAKQSDELVPKSNYLYIAIIILEMIVLYFTATRSAILGLFGGIFIMAILIAIFAREQTHEQKSLRKIAISTIIAVLIVIGGFFAIRNQSFVQNNFILNRFNAISIQSLQDQSRYHVWIMALQGIKEHPVLGWGQENFNLIADKYYRPALYNELSFDRAHNFVLDWLVSGGVLGLLAYISIFTAAFYYIWSRKNNHWSVVEKSVLTGLLAGYLINNLFLFDNIVSYILSFTMLAYIYSQTRAPVEEIAVIVTTKPIKHDSKKDRQQKESEKRELIGVFLIPTILIVLFLVYYINMDDMRAAYDLEQAYAGSDTVSPENVSYFKEALTLNSSGKEEIRQKLALAAIDDRYSTDFDDSLRQNFFNLALTEMNKQIQETPSNSLDMFIAGSLLYSYGKYDEALIDLKKAQILSPQRQEILSKIGDVYIAKRDYKDAYDITKKSFDLEPRYDVARMSYTIATMLNGDTNSEATASQILTDGFGTDLLFDRQLMLAYAATNQIDKLVSIYTTRIQQHPEDIQSTISLAASYLKLNRRDEAIQTLQDAAKKSPDYSDRITTWITQIKAGQNPQ